MTELKIRVNLSLNSQRWLGFAEFINSFAHVSVFLFFFLCVCSKKTIKDNLQCLFPTLDLFQIIRYILSVVASFLTCILFIKCGFGDQPGD